MRAHPPTHPRSKHTHPFCSRAPPTRPPRAPPRPARRYTQSLGRRGLHATALEVCKLLLGVNEDDPMGATLCIDYLALRWVGGW